MLTLKLLTAVGCKGNMIFPEKILLDNINSIFSLTVSKVTQFLLRKISLGDMLTLKLFSFLLLQG